MTYPRLKEPIRSLEKQFWQIELNSLVERLAHFINGCLTTTTIEIIIVFLSNKNTKLLAINILIK